MDVCPRYVIQDMFHWAWYIAWPPEWDRDPPDKQNSRAAPQDRRERETSALRDELTRMGKDLEQKLSSAAKEATATREACKQNSQMLIAVLNKLDPEAKAAFEDQAGSEEEEEADPRFNEL